MTIRVYKYGLRPPADPAPVWQQIRLGHDYQNKLVEIEREHRARYVAARAKLFPEVAELEARLETETSKPDRRDLARTLREAKKSAKKSEVLALAADEIEESKKTAQKAVRAEFSARGLYWGTYLLREQAHKAACRGPEPKFHTWRGAGYIGARVQTSPLDKMTGIDVAHLCHEKSTVFQVDALPADQWDTRPGRRRAYTTLRVRIGSDGRAPVWAEFPVLQHRPFPPGSRVRGLRVCARRVGRRVEWSADFTLDVPDHLIKERVRGRGIAGVDVGWRRLEDGRVRVAVLYDGANHEEICLPEGVEYRARKAHDVEGIRDRAANKIRKKLDGVLDVSNVRSKTLLRDIIDGWRSDPHENLCLIDIVMEEARHWAYRDRHLEDYASGCRTRAARIRGEFYRLLARRWRATYGAVGIEKLRVSEVIQVDPDVPRAARLLQKFAATGELLAEIRSVFGQDCVEVDPVNTSRQCAGCGKVGEWSSPEKLVQHCETCARDFDQDENAAAIIRERALAEKHQPLGL